MFGLFRKGDANDPDTYVAGITAILAQYDEEVIRRVTDPIDGIARKSKWMPNPSELSDACDADAKFLKNQEDMRVRGWEWVDGTWVKTG